MDFIVANSGWAVRPRYIFFYTICHDEAVFQIQQQRYIVFKITNIHLKCMFELSQQFRQVSFECYLFHV